MWSHLSREISPDDPSSTDARRRVMARLAEYTAEIVRPLNMRPTAAALLCERNDRVEVRISAPSSHIVLVIAPEGDLAAEVAWLRALATRNLPAPRLLGHDQSCGTVPFPYAIESHCAGVPLATLDSETLQRVAARQVGRALRRTHQIRAAGWGRPTITGRWPSRSWAAALAAWLPSDETLAAAAESAGADVEELRAALTLEPADLACDAPAVLHGALTPRHVLVTAAESVQLEALVEPGALVGGDPLFDLAHGLLPWHAEAFRQGLLEGYQAVAPLDAPQAGQLARLARAVTLAEAVRRGDAAELERALGAPRATPGTP